MLVGNGSPDKRAAKLGAYDNPKQYSDLLKLLADTVAWHLIRQIEAGADAVQIFDSWAGGLPEKPFAEWVVAPNKRVVTGVRKVFPDTPIIGFPGAASEPGYRPFVKDAAVDAVSID